MHLMNNTVMLPDLAAAMGVHELAQSGELTLGPLVLTKTGVELAAEAQDLLLRKAELMISDRYLLFKNSDSLASKHDSLLIVDILRLCGCPGEDATRSRLGSGVVGGLYSGDGWPMVGR